MRSCILAAGIALATLVSQTVYLRETTERQARSINRSNISSDHLIDQFLANPTHHNAKILVLAKRIMTPGAPMSELSVTKLSKTSYAIVFRYGLCLEYSGLVTVSTDRTLTVLADGAGHLGLRRCTLSLEELGNETDTKQQVLLARVGDGGSGGFDEDIQLFLRNQSNQWTAAGSIPFCNNSRSGDFSELCGAAKPRSGREVELQVTGQTIRVNGTENHIRRLKTTSAGIQYENKVNQIAEVYQFQKDRFVCVSRQCSILKLTKHIIPTS